MSAIKKAAEMLRREAESMKECHTLRGDWCGDPAEADYHEMIAVAAAAIEMIERIEAAEKSDAESLAMYRRARDERDALRAALRHEADCVEAAKAEIEALRAKIEATEQQEPARLVTATAYRWRYRGAVMWQYGELTEETARRAKEHNHEVQPLYALPGAHPAPSALDVDALAQIIREVDGKRQLCAGALAERIVEWLAEAPEAKP